MPLIPVNWDITAGNEIFSNISDLVKRKIMMMMRKEKTFRVNISLHVIITNLQITYLKQILKKNNLDKFPDFLNTLIFIKKIKISNRSGIKITAR